MADQAARRPARMMHGPGRSAIKIFFADGIVVDPPLMVALFHEWIRNKIVEGMLIDVADYKHVHEGPSIVLVGHDVDYTLDLSEARPGLMVTRKHPTPSDLAEDIRQGVRRVLSAARALQRRTDPHPPVRFRTDELRVQVIDRLRFPQSADAVEAVSRAIEPLFAKLFDPSGFTIENAAADARMPVTLRVRAAGAPPLDTLIARL